MALSEASCIIAQKSNERAQIALSSFIRALEENELVALVRLVTKDDKPPVMLMMAPSIEPDYECLVDVQVCLALVLLTLGTVRRGHQALYFRTTGQSHHDEG
jgi:ATP-dependent DNA helicase 2 subunit 2